MYRIGCGRPVTVAFRPLGSTELWGTGLLQMTDCRHSELRRWVIFSATFQSNGLDLFYLPVRLDKLFSSTTLSRYIDKAKLA